MSGIDDARVQIEDRLQRPHVIVQILEDGGALAQNAVAAEDRVLLQQMQYDVVRGVARRVDYADSRAFDGKFLSVLQEFELRVLRQDVSFCSRVFPYLAVS